MKRKVIIVSVISELTTDQRVIRISSTLQDMGFEVVVIARQFADSLPLDNYTFRAKRIRCIFRKGFMQFAEFNTKLFFRLLFSKTDYFLANDLDTLIPNYVVSKLRGKKLFYDTHEYYTGVPELKDSPFKKKFWKFFENRIFPKLKVVYTVSNSIKKLYQEEYGNEISVIRNVPVSINVEPIPPPKHWFGKKILLMQGVGIHPGRGGLEMLGMMKYLPDNYHLVYIGGGTHWNTITEKRKEWGLEDKVEMISKLPPVQLKQYTQLAHLGFSLDGFNDINYLFNLPNKLFDYIHAGIPVVATATPQVKSIIDQFKCGICVNAQSPNEMAQEVMALINDEKNYRTLKENATIAAKELCWEKEKHKLISIYQPFV